MPAQGMELVFPLKGINDTWGFGKQPEGTCPDALNCVPFDPLDLRARGGQRWGISKYYIAQHNGSEALQRMTSIASVGSAGEGTFTHANAPFWSAYPDTWDHYTSDFKNTSTENATFNAVISADAESVAIVDNQIKQEDTGLEFSEVHIYTGRTYTFSDSYSISFHVRDADPGGGVGGTIWVILFRVDPTYNGNYYGIRFQTQITAGLGQVSARLIKGDGTGYETVQARSTAGFDADVGASLIAGTTFTINITSGGAVSVDLGSIPAADGNPFVFTTDMDSYEDNYGVGFGFYTANGETTFYFDDFTTSSPEMGLQESESGRLYKLIAISGGDVYEGIPPATLALATNGTNAVATSGRADMQPAFGKIYFADGNPSHYKYFDNADDTVYSWTANITAGLLPCDATSTNTTYAIATADAATKKFTYTGDLTAIIFVNDYIKVSGSTDNDGIYSVSAIAEAGGTTTITVRQTVVNSGADGNIQLCDLGCKIIKLYRGRIVMAGLKGDSHNWFMLKAGDPFDIDYGATPSAVMAVAGNNTDAGYCPDIITCLAPYSDDLMYIGGDHTLWIMTGDPADRGRIDNISYQTGISGPDAYTFDPNGMFYFFGSGTVWRMAAGSAPEPLSRNRMDQVFKDINLMAYTVQFAWDNERHGLVIFIVPKAEGATTHYYWDERTDSFWKIIFPNAQGPATTYAFDGDNPNDNALLLGGWDGYIRQPDSSADDDDGTAIDSYVLYPPIAAGGPLNNIRINSVTAVLDTESDDVVMTMYAEDTVQKTIESATIRFARSLKAGRTKVLSRVAGNAIMIKLSNSTDDETWAIETLLANVETIGRTRKNQL